VKPTAVIFVVYAAFFAVITVIYWFASYEWAGTVLLGLLIGATALIGAHLFTQVRHRPAPLEDRTDAVPADAAGEEVGRFPSASIWPFVAGVAVLVLALGLVFSTYVALPGAVLLVFAIVGMAREVPAGG
jgi:hypothetical protein